LPFDRRGAVFLITRIGTEYGARWVSGVGIYPCHGMREPASEQALRAALAEGGRERVTRLYRHADVPVEQCWLKAPDWCLAYA
jgi:protein-L-isoaspartate(D-aspartate) O-methyltransferase